MSNGAVKRVLFIAAVIFCAVPCRADEVARSTAPVSIRWTAGEKLVFKVGWGVITAGEGILEVRELAELAGGDGRQIQAYHFVATAKSNGFFDAFYKVRDVNESWLEPGAWVSRRFEQHNREGKYVLEQSVDFDWENKRFKSVKNVEGRKPEILEGDLTIPAVDTLSSLYYTRGLDFKVGDEWTLDVHSDKYWPLVVKVLKRETVKVPAGKFDCFLVEPFLREPGIFIQKGKKMQVWMTADESHMPVKMTAEIFIGHVFAELEKIER